MNEPPPSRRPNRRGFLARTGAYAAAAALPRGRCKDEAGATRGGTDTVTEQAVREGATLPKPTPAQLDWQNCELGVIYHFDMPVAAGVFSRNNTVRKVFDPNLYNPVKLDTDQWLAAATGMGAKYAVFTATHFNGFMQWQSDAYPYGVKQTTWRHGKGDVVGDFVASCRRVGIRPGIYLSCHRNVYCHLWNHYVDWGKGRGTEAQARYNRVAERQVEELCSRYGPLLELWFDAGVKTPAEGGPDVLPLVEKWQPRLVFYSSRQRADHRWIGNEQGVAGVPCWATMPRVDGEVSHNARSWRKCLATGDPNGKAWSPAMVDVPLRGSHGVHSWLFMPNQEHGVDPLPRLLEMYYRSVGRNCNFIVGVVVTPEGLVPRPDIDRLTGFGAEIRRRFTTPVARTAGTGGQLRLKLPTAQRIDHAVITEDIRHGERIRRYRVEGLKPPATWVALCAGESIGHKRIERFAGVEVLEVRLMVEDATATPLIEQFSVYHVGA